MIDYRLLGEVTDELGREIHNSLFTIPAFAGTGLLFEITRAVFWGVAVTGGVSVPAEDRYTRAFLRSRKAC